ncbi:MAG: hypothetical protein MZV63_60865 [Marinilabiliales bacterium]|nr:hypothetical protein [Marinilabiliales bacterium]
MKHTADHTPHIHSYLSLRKSVGWIGILLPFVLVFGHTVFFGGDQAPSQYQRLLSHRHAVIFFVGAICAIALFLFFYRGYDRWDNISCKCCRIFLHSASPFSQP